MTTPCSHSQPSTRFNSAFTYMSPGIFSGLCRLWMCLFVEISLSVSALLCEWAHLRKCGKTFRPFKVLCKMSIRDANVQDMDKTSSSTCETFELGEFNLERSTATFHVRKVLNFSYLHILLIPFPLLSPGVVMHSVLGFLTFFFYTVYLRALTYFFGFSINSTPLTSNLHLLLWNVVQNL